MTGLLDRALAYLDKLPPAVSGSGGHNATLRAACECWRFGLDAADVMVAMEWFNRMRCQPVWKDHELAHKVEDARKLVAASGKLAMRAGGPGKSKRGRPSRTFQPVPVPVVRRARVAVMWRPVAEEEAWWAERAAEMGLTLAEFDQECGC